MSRKARTPGSHSREPRQNLSQSQGRPSLSSGSLNASDTGDLRLRGQNAGDWGWASPGRSGEGRTDLDGDFGPLLLLVGRGGTWQQQEEDGPHDEGGGKEDLHVPLREAQHPPGKESAAPAAEGRKRVGTRWREHRRHHRERLRGETGAPASLLAGGRPYFPPLDWRRVVGPCRGRGPARQQGWPRRGLVGGCHVSVAPLAPHLARAHQQEEDPGRRHRPEEHEDWVSEETTNPSMQSGHSRDQSCLRRG